MMETWVKTIKVSESGAKAFRNINVKKIKEMFQISARTRKLIEGALKEDIGSGDITSDLFVPPHTRAEAYILAKANGVLAGAPVVREVFRVIDPSLNVISRMQDGTVLRKGQVVFVIKGNLRSILKGERVALNFLGRLSGIATLTHKFVSRVKGTKARIFATRKTTPLWRELEKYAVRCGGGHTHRFGLYDEILVKENHWTSVPNDVYLEMMVKQVRKKRFTEIEVRNLAEFNKVLSYEPHAILLDNFRPGLMRKAVAIAKKFKPRPQLEASGGILLENVRTFAVTGVDRISIGALTHSAPVFDMSLLVYKVIRK